MTWFGKSIFGGLVRGFGPSVVLVFLAFQPWFWIILILLVPVIAIYALCQLPARIAASRKQKRMIARAEKVSPELMPEAVAVQVASGYPVLCRGIQGLKVLKLLLEADYSSYLRTGIFATDGKQVFEPGHRDYAAMLHALEPSAFKDATLEDMVVIEPSFSPDAVSVSPLLSRKLSELKQRLESEVEHQQRIRWRDFPLEEKAAYLKKTGRENDPHWQRWAAHDYYDEYLDRLDENGLPIPPAGFYRDENNDRLVRDGRDASGWCFR